MGHHHTNSEKNISFAFFLNAFFACIELAGGLWTNSIAILSDAVHDFGDCLSLGIAWILQKKSSKGGDDKYSYGYKRFSLLGSIFLSGILTISSVIVVIEAAERLFEPQQVNAEGMLVLAVIGLVVNGISALRLHKGSSLNERAVFLHLMEDVLGWAAVLAAGIVIKFAYIPVLDPILSIAISIWVLSHVYGNLKKTFRILLQAIPDDVSMESLKKDILETDGVVSLHDLHVWSMDGESHIMTLHVVTDSPNPDLLKEKIASAAAKYRISHSTIELESPGTICSRSCDNHESQ